MKYNKLVRDKIPEIIKADKQTPITHIANQKEFKQKLLEKLQEEVGEFLKEQNTEELADIVNTILLAKVDSSVREHLYQPDNPPAGTDNWGQDKVKQELRNRQQKTFNSINNGSVSADFSSGKVKPRLWVASILVAKLCALYEHFLCLYIKIVFTKTKNDQRIRGFEELISIKYHLIVMEVGLFDKNSMKFDELHIQ